MIAGLVLGLAVVIACFIVMACFVKGNSEPFDPPVRVDIRVEDL